MLARYQIIRGKRPSDQPLPDGIRQDTRKHTRHCLRPTAEIVAKFLGNTDEAAWDEFENRYLALLRERFAQDPRPFEEIAERAQSEDVYLGCNCPTKQNPDVRHCHTVLALRFMAEKFPELEIRFPFAGAP